MINARSLPTSGLRITLGVGDVVFRISTAWQARGIGIINDAMACIGLGA